MVRTVNRTGQAEGAPLSLRSTEPTLGAARRVPPLTTLSDEGWAGLAPWLALRRFRGGELLIAEDDRGDAVHFLVDGEVAIRSGGDLIVIRAAPRMIGLLSAIDRMPRSASVEAFDHAVSVRLSGDRLRELAASNPAFARCLMEELARELRELQRLEREHHRAYQDFLVSPNARLLAGQFVSRPFDQYLFVVDVRRADAATLLPPGARMVPGLGGRCLLTFNFYEGSVNPHYPAEALAPYREASYFVPCLGPSFVPALFCPEQYVDNYLMISLGREVLGLPRRYGSVALGESKIDLIVDDHMILRAGFRGAQRIDPGTLARRLTLALTGEHRDRARVLDPLLTPLLRDEMGGAPEWLPPVRILVHREVPDASPDRAGSLRVDRLLEVPFELLSLDEPVELDAPSLRFFPKALFAGECVAAFRVRISFRFGRARTLKDYLAAHAAGRANR
jgi:CRP-like cAMP-binding protein